MRLFAVRYSIAYVMISLSSFMHAAPANTVVATIPVGISPSAIAITPDNRYAYVTNSNNYGDPGSDNVSFINLMNNLVEKTINDPSFDEPYRLIINDAGTKVYVTNSVITTISIIDTATNTVTSTIGGFDGPSAIAKTPNGMFAYVTNYGVVSGTGTTVRKVDLNTDMIVGAPIVVGLAPAALAITPDGAFVYVANYTTGLPGAGTISIIRTSDDTVVGTIPGFSGPFGIAITPDGKFAYVTNFGSNDFFPYGTTVSVVDLSTDAIIATINLAIQPAGIAITPDGRFVYVTNYNTLYASGAMPPFNSLTPGQGTVNIIDVATNTVIPPTIAVDDSPSGLAISAKGEFAYVTNYIANTVNVIALQSFAIEVQGSTTRNIFLTQVDLINKLTISASGTSLPVSYSIYRDAALMDLIAVVPAAQMPTYYLDHNRQPGISYTYYIVGTNGVGTTSDPVAVTITQPVIK